LHLPSPFKSYVNQLHQTGNMFLYTGCVCCLLEIIIWITKVLSMKETSKLRFLTRREKERTREHTDVKSAKFQRKRYFS